MDEKQKWENLTISNDFMFAKVMRNRDICRKILEKILKVEIKRIEYHEEQKEIKISYDSKSVRLDVYVKDEKNTVYNLEMQTTNTRNLPKRSRYYQGMIDLDLIEKGKSYNKLNKSFVIFICTFDPFGEGRHIYTFKYICEENKELYLNDEGIKIFLNSKGKLEDVDEDVKSFLKYVDGRFTDNELVREIDEEIKRVKGNKEWEAEYMTLLMREIEIEERALERGKEEGRKEGIKLGEERGIKLGEERGIKLGEEKGIKTLIRFCREFNFSLEDTYKQIMEKYKLAPDNAKEMIRKYWK